MTRALKSAAILAGLCAVLSAAAAPARESGADSPRLALTSTSQGLQIRSSKAGQAVVSAEDMAPGHQAVGTISVRVRGGPTRVSLRARRFDRAPGPHGASLAEELHLQVVRLVPGPEHFVYDGPALGMRSKLKHWRPNSRRRYGFVVELPSDAGNALQGAATSFALVWKARAVS